MDKLGDSMKSNDWWQYLCFDEEELVDLTAKARVKEDLKSMTKFKI
jgi:hypothetical protein